MNNRSVCRKEIRKREKEIASLKAKLSHTSDPAKAREIKALIVDRQDIIRGVSEVLKSLEEK